MKRKAFSHCRYTERGRKGVHTTVVVRSGSLTFHIEIMTFKYAFIILCNDVLTLFRNIYTNVDFLFDQWIESVPMKPNNCGKQVEIWFILYYGQTKRNADNNRMSLRRRTGKKRIIKFLSLLFSQHACSNWSWSTVKYILNTCY